MIVRPVGKLSELALPSYLLLFFFFFVAAPMRPADASSARRRPLTAFSSASPASPPSPRERLRPVRRDDDGAAEATEYDAGMAETYDALALRAYEALSSKRIEEADSMAQLWIAVAGGPGSGKSTLAGAVARRICDLYGDGVGDAGVDAVAIPMDGYHLSRSDLTGRFPDPAVGMLRRGAPWTFDAEGLCGDLAAARDAGEAGLPSYCREISDPVPDSVRLERRHGVVLVEGNYLLLGRLLRGDSDDGGGGRRLSAEAAAEVADGLGCPLPLEEEVARWKPLDDLWDETWFVSPPGGVPEQRRRVLGRSLETWTQAKTDAWGGGTEAEAAARRVDYNDVKNARLVECCRGYADLVIDSV